MAFVAHIEYGALRRPNFEWDDEPKPMAMWMLGTGVPLEDLSLVPRRATQTDKKKLCDVFPMPGLNAVSERFKTIVEEYEPGVHQFIPISLKAKDGTPYDEPYYIFNACQTIACVLADVSPRQSWVVKKAGRRKGMPFVNGPDSDLVLSKPAIDGHHVWTGELIKGGTVFFSDVLEARMEKEKIRYLYYRKAEEIDRPFDAVAQIRPTIDWLLENDPDWVAQKHPEWLELQNR